MCRSAKETADKKPLRCEGCNEPQTRRDRQNLANAIKREQGNVSQEVEETAGNTPAEPETITSLVVEEVQQLELPEEDKTVVTEAVTTLLTDPEVTRELAESVRAARESAENERAWILGDREDTPENLALGLAERQKEILLVGSALADRAQEIHGVDIEKEREAWQERIGTLRKQYEEATGEAHTAEKAFIEYRAELIEKYDADYHDYEEKISPEEEAEQERLRLEKVAKQDIQDEARESMRNSLRGYDKETAAVLDRIAEGNRQAVAEVRSIGNVPVEFEEKIRGGDGGELFKSAVAEVFPDDWVQKSNELGSLSLVRTASREGRVHYSPVKKDISPYAYTWPTKPDERDARFKGWQESLDENGNPTGEWEGPKRDILQREPDIRTYKKFNKDGTPKGTGWQQGVAIQDGKEIPIWYRDNETDKKRIASTVLGAKITVNMNGSERDSKDDFRHEFSHRIEDANPHIAVLEEGFIASRTTGPDGRRDPLISYEGSKKERIRPDNFVRPYIGKEYEGQSMREVLSMGTESVFGGNHGGLVGIGENRTDLEMRNWILGVYATA